MKSIKLLGLNWIALCLFTPNPTICIQRPDHSGMHCRQAQPESYVSTSLAIAVFSVQQVFFLLYYYLMAESQNSDLQTEPS